MPRGPLDDGNLSTRQVADELGITYRRARWLATEGIVRPAVPAGGPGTRMRWSKADVAEARRIVARIDWGMTHQAAARHEDPPLPFTNAEA